MRETQAAEERYWKSVNEILHPETDVKFQVDQEIVWTRESKGRTVKKHGTVLAVVYPGRIPNKDHFPSLFGKHPENHKEIGKPRKDYSYVIQWKDGSISWPLAQYLSAAEEKTAGEVTKVEATLSDGEKVGKPLIEVLGKEHIDESKVTTVYMPDDEDVESQVKRSLSMSADDIISQIPEDDWSKYSHKRSFQDGDGQIKNNSNPDRELGYHLRGALRILSETFFGKKKESTGVLKDEHETFLRNEVARLKGVISLREADVERLTERVKKEMAFPSSGQVDLEVDKLRKELEFKTNMLNQSELSVKSLTDDRYLLSQEVEKWKSQYSKLLEEKLALQKSIELIVEKTSMTLSKDRQGEVAQLQSDIERLKNENESFQRQLEEALDQRGELHHARLVSGGSTLSDDAEGYQNELQSLKSQIEDLETHATRREEWVVTLLEKIERLEADAKDAKSKNEVLPEPAVKFLQSEVIRLQGELATAKESAEHYRTQSLTKVKPGLKASSDEETIRNAIRFTMDKAYSGVSGSDYRSSDNLVDSMYKVWDELRK